MAEFLLTTPAGQAAKGPSKDAGDVLAVREDDALNTGTANSQWGRLEDKGKFLALGGQEADWHGKTIIARVLNLSVAASLQVLEPTWATLSVPEGTEEVVDKMRSFNLRWDALPTPQRDAILAAGFVEIDVSQIRGNILKKSDDSQPVGW